jgi:hypothetical protein
MNITDIRRSILYQINDIETLRAACEVDKLARYICRQRAFWVHFFSKYNLPLGNVDYDTMTDWIAEFNVTKKAYDRMLQLMIYIFTDSFPYVGFFTIIDIDDIDIFMSKNETENTKLENFLTKHDGDNLFVEINYDPKKHNWKVKYYIANDGGLIFKYNLDQIRQYLFNVMYNDIDITPIDDIYK